MVCQEDHSQEKQVRIGSKLAQVIILGGNVIILGVVLLTVLGIMIKGIVNQEVFRFLFILKVRDYKEHCSKNLVKIH